VKAGEERNREKQQRRKSAKGVGSVDGVRRQEIEGLLT